MSIEFQLDTTPANILCVDDEPNVLKSLRRLFRGAEYIIHLAESGAEGLEILEQQAIDLVISDMRMPHMDGAEFLTRVATQWPDTIRILLTGYADIESTIAAVNQGKIYSYCSKPWDDSELKALVAKAIEEKRLREERVQLFEIIHQKNAQLEDLNSHLEEKVEQRTVQLKNSFKQLDKAHISLKRQYTDSIKTFAKIIEMRPGIRSGHSTYIANFSRRVAIQLKMSDEEVKSILYAGLLLQIGKMGFPDDLISQPYFLMAAGNRENYLRHAVEGESLLKEMEQLKDAAILIKYQFEHFDGSGYPEGLLGENIPKGARILHVVRDYISFMEGSMTGETMSVSDVKTRLLEKKDTYYDPVIVDTFLEILKETKDDSVRPIVEIPWTQLLSGMEVAEIHYDDRLYLKDCVLEKKDIYDIVALREKVGDKLVIKIRLGVGENVSTSSEVP
ncbi:MAG: response regulator [Methylococcaceae bacterium]|nr:response regulator [Methylococcaceae bacterium]